MSTRLRHGRGAGALRVLGVVLGLGLVWFVSDTTGAPSSALLVAALIAAGTAATALGAVSTGARALISLLAARLGASVAPPPAESAELPTVIVQSRPDAPGKPSPRAPGQFLAAA
ncbi:DUF6412 domain-containing protein [Herbiconiux sp. YIM B11900]|uniref:DUF6412 domain-containing protein n=1 Tax=Herbiconiux sp. YIM B11900 TaxID=3404131 RepID=UPI003F87C1F4